MKKLIRNLSVLFLLVVLSLTVYGAVCKDSNGTTFCGNSCTTSGSSCSCEGECSAAELEVVAN